MTGPAPESRDVGAGVVVIGNGAVGSFVGALLAGAGLRVTLLGRPGRGTGVGQVVVRDPDGGVRRVGVECADGPDRLAVPAFAILAVKMPDLAAAVETCRGWPEIALVTLQNGIGAEELVTAARPASPLIAGSLTAPIEREPDGTLAWRKRRGVAFGSVRGETGLVLAALRAALDSGGLPVAIRRDWRAMKWSKLLTNLVANAIPALLDRDDPGVYADRRLYDLERAQIREVLAVMRALRLAPVPLPGADVRWLAIGFRAPAAIAGPVLRRVVVDARGGKAPSLLLHLRAGGGPSESPWLNGAVARAGAGLAVPTPVNRSLADLVEAAAADPAAWARTRGRPDALLAAVAHASITQPAG